MTEPLALLFYENLIRGSQLSHRLQDRGYRVEVMSSAAALTERAGGARPLIVIAELGRSAEEVTRTISELRKDAITAHVPVIVFADREDRAALDAAVVAGAALAVPGEALLEHLPQLLDQALKVE